jgi:hypothetical protein
MKRAEHVIYGLDEAVMTMHKGEVASFTIPPQHAFGAAGSNQYQLALVPPNSVVIYEIEHLSVCFIHASIFLLTLFILSRHAHYGNYSFQVQDDV